MHNAKLPVRGLLFWIVPHYVWSWEVTVPTPSTGAEDKITLKQPATGDMTHLHQPDRILNLEGRTGFRDVSSAS